MSRFEENFRYGEQVPGIIKGVLTINNQFVLLKNEREEWELPGGRIEVWGGTLPGY